jgi:hypothetical protein
MTAKVIINERGTLQSPTCKNNLLWIHDEIQTILLHDVELSLCASKIRIGLGSDDLALEISDTVDFPIIGQNHHGPYGEEKGFELAQA